MPKNGNPLIEIKRLETHFKSDEGVVRAVDDVSFDIEKRESVGIVGESGCGKSVTALSILRLVPMPPGRIVGGDIFLNGESLLKKSNTEMCQIRGNRISMIFQEPMTSLNPVFSVGAQIMEAIQLHQKVTKSQAKSKCIEMLKTVGIPAAEHRIDDFPHQMSGGMRQRVMIAMALSCRPELLIADEPTTALDVTIQAQILELMRKLRDQFGMAVMLITHDLGVVAEFVHKVIVMYAGTIVEQASTVNIFTNPMHPYTLGLIKSIPRVESDLKRLPTIEGVIPNPFQISSACRFQSRCSMKKDICLEHEPELFEVENDHMVRCWLKKP